MNEQRSSSSVVRGVRRAAIIAIIVSLAVAALLGIIALLSGDFGETQARILGTTLTVAAFGTTALCHLAVVARPVRVVGYIGIAASAVAALCALVLIWAELDWTVTDPLIKGLFVSGIAAASLAQTNLLLLLSGRAHRIIRVALGATLASIGIVAIMIILPILTDGEVPGERFDETWWRIFGVVAILDALGTIALPILGLVLGRNADGASSGGALTVVLPAYVAEQVRAAAARDARTPEDFTVWLVQSALHPPSAPPADATPEG